MVTLGLDLGLGFGVVEAVGEHALLFLLLLEGQLHLFFDQLLDLLVVESLEFSQEGLRRRNPFEFLSRRRSRHAERVERTHEIVRTAFSMVRRAFGVQSDGLGKVSLCIL